MASWEVPVVFGRLAGAAEFSMTLDEGGLVAVAQCLVGKLAADVWLYCTHLALGFYPRLWVWVFA